MDVKNYNSNFIKLEITDFKCNKIFTLIKNGDEQVSKSTWMEDGKVKT